MAKGYRRMVLKSAAVCIAIFSAAGASANCQNVKDGAMRAFANAPSVDPQNPDDAQAFYRHVDFVRERLWEASSGGAIWSCSDTFQRQYKALYHQIDTIGGDTYNLLFAYNTPPRSLVNRYPKNFRAYFAAAKEMQRLLRQ